MKRTDALLLAALLAACSSEAPNEPDVQTGGPVHVVAAEGALRITNIADRRIAVHVIESESAQLWLPPPQCTTGPICKFIAAGASLELPYANIEGFRSGSRQAVVFWWDGPPPQINGGVTIRL